MKKKILSVLLCSLFMVGFTTKVYAAGIDQILNGSQGENSNNSAGGAGGGGKPTSGGSSTSSGSKKPGNNSSSTSSGTKENPLIRYGYSSYDGNMNTAFSNFASEDTDGKTSVYRTPSNSSTTNSFLRADGEEVYIKTFNPTVKFQKWKDYHDNETSRVTDYYTWNCVGPDSWTTREGKDKHVVFHKTGRYTVTSVPHQVVRNEKWNTYTSRAYDVFSNGVTNTIKTFFWEEKPHRVITTNLDRTDLKRTWTFEITPAEVDKPIPLPPPGPNPPPGTGPTPIDPNTIDWDTQLIN